MIKKPELLAPAGRFTSAIYAFEYGADAVYVGLTDFSARKSAENFSTIDLAKLKKYAVQKGKKIYVTVNTVIREDEIPGIYEVLNFLTTMSVDGVIVQDLGIMDILKKSYPGLNIHASTQMAVHNSPGVSFLEKEGISRIILARELSTREITAIIKTHPNTEFEVFIHGALCYSFSGLCLASGKLTGRSANRGECSQICRTWFTDRTDRTEKKGYFFSMKDLGAYSQIEGLVKGGVSSLKIEGRMKTPEYTGFTVKTYRDILDKKNSSLKKDSRNYPESSLLAFSRYQNNNWLKGNFKALVVDTEYPSHRGIQAGKVLSPQKEYFILKTETEVSVRDGLMFLNGNDLPEPVRLSVKKMVNETGKNILTARKGTIIKIFTFSTPSPQKGQTIFKISSHNLRLPLIKSSGFSIWKKALDITVTLGNQTLSIESDTDMLKVAAFGKVSPEKARTKRDFTSILDPLLRASDKSFFSMNKLTFKNESSFGNNEIFIPPGVLKKIKNNFYKKADESFFSKDSGLEENTAESIKKTSRRMAVFPREKLNPKNNQQIPFALFDDIPELSDFACAEGEFYIPLMPVLFNHENYFEKLKSFIILHTDSKLVLGLNNPAHLEWAGELAKFNNVSFFADYGIYTANRKTYRFLTARIKKLKFIYFWIEGSREDYDNLVKNLTYRELEKTPVFRTGNEFKPHLFLSRGCYTNMLGGGRCPENCRKDFTYKLSQGKNKFTVVVKNCLTWLF